MSPTEASLVLFGLFFALMFLRVPIAFALGLACVPVLMIEDRLSPMVLFNETFKAYNSFILLAVPFFLLTRSEEHTSELQSLMRISYAVFCLKKKNTITTTD